MINQALWTALVTPFSNDGLTIDYTSLERLLRSQEASGNGVILLGSTGESLSLSDNERREIVTFAIKLNLNIPLMVGVPAHNHFQAVEWLTFCKDLPLAGFLMTTPIYTKPGEVGQTKWFESLLDLASAPAMLYNIPGRAGIKLNPKAVKNLSSHPKFAAIKDSGGDIESLVEYRAAAPNIGLYCGDDALMPSFACEGAIGLISVASNAWPAATRKYVELCLNGKRFDTSAWWEASNALFAASNPIPIKSLLHAKGDISSPTLRLPLTHQELKSNEQLLAADQLISKWYQEWS